MRAKEHRLNFGKYRGQTLEEVYVEDKAYLEWLVDALREDDVEKGQEVPNPWIQTIKLAMKEMANVRIY